MNELHLINVDYVGRPIIFSQLTIVTSMDIGDAITLIDYAEVNEIRYTDETTI